jgi:septal ring factor EnvC (AmiA/AmiB activator)
VADQAKQLLLVALSSEHPGEAFNALGLVRRAIAKLGLDIHQFVNGIGAATGQDSYLADRLAKLEREMMVMRLEVSAAERTIARLTRENSELRQAHSATERAADARSDDSGIGHQEKARRLLEALSWNATTESFLTDMATWRYPTDKQMAWLDSLWSRYGDVC